jgi:hypothetical protein
VPLWPQQIAALAIIPTARVRSHCIVERALDASLLSHGARVQALGGGVGAKLLHIISSSRPLCEHLRT